MINKTWIYVQQPKNDHEYENMIKKNNQKIFKWPQNEKHDYDHKMTFTTPRKIHKHIVPYVTQAQVACN